MLELSTPRSASRWTLDARGRNETVGIVPTMGALHEGHLSLVRMSRDRCQKTVVSIFVNPTQFGPGEDLDRYPRTLKADLAKLRDESVDAVFIPTAKVMYPKGFSTFVEPPEVAKSLEGLCRPNHFRGVTTIVLKLFHAVPATHAFFGRKDYQQLRVIDAMTRDLDVAIEIIAGETVRETDGLAMSSRNRYLDPAERRRALRIPESLRKVVDLASRGETEIHELQQTMRQHLLGQVEDSGQPTDAGQNDGVDKIDYAVVVDADRLSPMTTLDRPAVALIAAHVGGTRLIDNCPIFPTVDDLTEGGMTGT